MALESTADLNAFFDTDAHGSTVTYTPSGGSASTINGILNNEFELVDIGDVGVESNIPILTVKTSDVSSVAQGDTFVIDSVTYKSVIIRPDGTGITEIVLEKQ
tara:strand:+ start:2478 stop:2786 length:309 start_codon:yes stop_codon:yes gene_type:complete